MAVETVEREGAGTQPGVRVTVDGRGIATVVIDQPGEKVNVMNLAFIEDFERAVAELGPDLKGVILTSGKAGQFVAGADLKQLLQATRPEEAAELVRRLHRVLNRMESLPYPSVAAVNGAALGGGLELTLACDYRVCVESNNNPSGGSGSLLGSPEVQLGLLPAGGACQRLPRLIGLSRALGLILEGKRYSPRRARKYGVVDEVVHPAVLMEAARAWLGKGKRPSSAGRSTSPSRAPRSSDTQADFAGGVPARGSGARLPAHPQWSWLDRAAERWPAVRNFIYKQAEKTVRKKTHGHYPAPLKALDAVRAGQEQGFGAGLAAEAVAFGELATGSVARNLIQLFFATENLKKEQRALTPQALTVDRVGVVGAGFMGAGIAQAATVGGFAVRMRDVKPEQVARGMKTARDLTLSAARKARHAATPWGQARSTPRFSRPEAREIVSRLSGTIDYSGFGRAQLVIEAVFEDLNVKRQVVAELEEALRPEAVIASNTSSLPIGSLAAGAKHPARIVGMHFFSPVHKIPLLEVVRPARRHHSVGPGSFQAADSSSEQAVATAVEVGRAMGKTVIVVGDGPGFYTTRVLGFMVQEAGRVFEQGASIESVDRAMTDFGFPVGPLALTDEVGLDVAAHVAEVLAQGFGERYTVSGAIQRMVEAGRLGRKSKLGFYDYHGKKKPDPAVYAFRQAKPEPDPPEGQQFPKDLIQRRLVLTFVNEAVRCLEEGVIASPRDGDVGAVMGIGFPPFLGGPFRYADQLGARSIVEQLRQMEYAYGKSFMPAAMLERMAESGERFYE